MSTARVPHIPSAAAAGSGHVAAHGPHTVMTCSRLGRRANPPRLSLTDWLLSSRRR
jgi:hypothetical protein